MGIFSSKQSSENSSKGPQVQKSPLTSTQNHLNFAEVRDSIVIMRDGSLRTIILCSPTNYDLKSGGEKEAIEFAYQGFLNGLHFPVQICIQSRRIDLDGYLEKLEQLLSDQPNPLLAGLMEDYIYNIRDLLNVANIMDKKFFVIVPLYLGEVTKENVFKQLGATFAKPQNTTQTEAQFNDHKNELIQRTNMVAQGLASIGVRAAVLKTQEIIELFYSSYNVDESETQALVDSQNMTVPYIEREGGNPRPYTPPPKEQEPPDLYAASRQNQNQGGQQ